MRYLARNVKQISPIFSSSYTRLGQLHFRLKLFATMSCDNAVVSRKCAAEKAVAERKFENTMIIGIGSGSTIVHVVESIAQTVNKIKRRADEEGKKSDLNVICVPSSFQARQLIIENNLTLGSLDSYPVVDWTIDGADEVDEKNNIIKGGGGCLTQEKILASCSKKFFIVAADTKFSSKLGTVWKNGIPVEVIPVSYVAVKRKIECQFGGEAALRMAVKKAGPVVTDNNNFILDWKFPDRSYDWRIVENAIKMIPGVVEIGLFLNMASKIYIGSSDGNVTVFSHEKN